MTAFWEASHLGRANTRGRSYRIRTQSQFAAGVFLPTCELQRARQSTSLASRVQEPALFGKRVNKLWPQCEFITTSRDSHQPPAQYSFKRKHVKVSRQLFRSPTTFPCCIYVGLSSYNGGHEDGLLQDSMVTRRGQSSGTEREREDWGEEGLPLAASRETNYNTQSTGPQSSPVIIWRNA